MSVVYARDNSGAQNLLKLSLSEDNVVEFQLRIDTLETSVGIPFTPLEFNFQIPCASPVTIRPGEFHDRFTLPSRLY